MKISYVKLTPLMASIAAFGLSLTPVLHAADMPDQSANSKAQNSADSSSNKSTTTGDSTQSGAMDKTNSKDSSNSLDKNPGQSPTGSGEQSATKEPTGTTTDEKTHMSKSGKSDADQPMTDKQFIETAAQGGMTEVELGKIAQDKGMASEVKTFGSHMVDDHSKANAELKSIADKKGVMVPEKLDTKHQAMVDKFQHMSGAAFDKAYVRAMVKDHEKTADCFREEAKTSKDADLKAFAGDTLKTIEMHLSDIKSIQSSMK